MARLPSLFLQLIPFCLTQSTTDSEIIAPIQRLFDAMAKQNEALGRQVNDPASVDFANYGLAFSRVRHGATLPPAATPARGAIVGA